MSAATDGCALCGLPCPHDRFRLKTDGRPAVFCCLGCQQVYQMLAEAADSPDPSQFRHTALFKRCQEAGIIPRSAADLDGAASDPPPASADVGEPRALSPDQLSLHLAVEGMWCPACAWVIEAAVMRQSGVAWARCNFATDRLRCDYHPGQIAPDRISRAIQALGYRATPMDTRQPRLDQRRLLTRLAIACFLTMNVMMLSFALYSGFFTRLAPQDIHYLSWPLVVLATVVLVYGGGPIHHKAWAGLVAGRPGMEALISLGALSAFAYSLRNFWAGSINLYFDTACMLVSLVLVGKFLERRAKDRIQEDLGHYFDLMPRKVRRCSAQYPQGRYTRLEDLQPGDEFVVGPGEVVPADGIIQAGRGAVDEAFLTGEAHPVVKQAGAAVRSGTRVAEGDLRIRAVQVGAASTLGRMVAIMETALGSRLPVESRTDLMLRFFVPGVLALALATGAVLVAGGASLDEGFVRGLTVLVISCPCALGIAIPLARVAGVSLAARRGILVQDFAAFEQAERIDTVVWDKTGTLTEGRWTLRAVRALGDATPEEILALAAGLEAEQEHPVAAEIRRAAARRDVAPLAVAGIKGNPRGVSGRWQGRQVRLGARDFAAPNAIPETQVEPAPAGDGGVDLVPSVIWLALDGAAVARLEFGDRLKPGARQALDDLRRCGHLQWLVSGDDCAATERVAHLLQIDQVRGAQSPEDKAALIRQLKQAGRTVAMVGDGVNDAPALVTADLALAVFAGRNLGREAQAVTLMRGDPAQVGAFLAFARRVNRTIGQNLAGAFVYNLAAIPLAMAGLLTPLVAVVAMLLSSLSVTGNTLRLIGGVNRAANREPAHGN
jgi:heavy metal translocating P-type ATPase